MAVPSWPLTSSIFAGRTDLGGDWVTSLFSASPVGQDFLHESTEETFEVSTDWLAHLRFNEKQGDSCSLELTSLEAMLLLFGVAFEDAKLISYKKRVGSQVLH